MAEIEPSIRLKLHSAIIAYDIKASKKNYNIYRLGLILKAFHEAESLVQGGVDLRAALCQCFNDRLLACLLKADGGRIEL